MKITLTAEDNSVTSFFDQAHVDNAVNAALANQAATNGLVKDIVVENTDGTTETFEAAEAPAVEAAEPA